MQYSLKYIAILVLIYFLSGFNGVNAEVDILSRNQWNAQPAKENDIITTRIEEKLVKRKPAVYLTVHHNQERVNEIPLDQQLKKHQILMFHYTIDDKKGEIKSTRHIILRDTPYHYLIDSTGQVAEGRELRFAAYSNTQYLTPIEKHITVVLEGDFDKVKPTNNQIQSLVLLLTELAKVHDIRLKNIGYHRNVVKKEVRKDGSVKYGTDCPGKNLIEIFDQEVKQKLAGNGVR